MKCTSHSLRIAIAISILSIAFASVLGACAGVVQSDRSNDVLISHLERESAPLSFTLDAKAACCGDADTEAGGSTVRVYIKAAGSHAASHQLIVGEGDTVVLTTGTNGAMGEEVFRTAPLPRGDDGGLEFTIDSSLLPDGALVLWSAGQSLPTVNNRPLHTVVSRGAASDQSNAPAADLPSGPQGNNG